MHGKKTWSYIIHLPRYREVANVLIKHGFGFVYERVNFRFARNGQKLMEQSLKQKTAARRLRLAFEELGPAFIKIGQLLSTRADFLPPEYIKELEGLQDNLPPFPFHEVKKIYAGAGIDIDQVFHSLNPEPIAAGSIGQVHEAVLKNGERVVVKVKRPGIDEVVEVDLQILLEISLRIEKKSQWAKFYRLHELVKELGEAVRNELDFRREAVNADKFYRNFKSNPNVVIPRIYWEYSGSNLLVMQHVGGVKITDIINLKKEGYDTGKIVRNLVDALFQQIYEDGFFHADPHPGNIAVIAGERLVFYDFGQVGMVDDFDRDKYINMVIGMMRYDVNGVTRALLDIAVDAGHVDMNELYREVSKLAQKYYGMPLAQINIGEALAEILSLSVKHQLRLPAELSLLVKMLLTLESIVAQLDPHVSLVDIAEPYGKKVLKKRYSIQKIQGELKETLLDFLQIARSFPRELSNLVKKAEQGELTIRTEYSNLKSLLSRVDVLSNRLSLAIILASIIIGSSLIINETSSSILKKIPLVEVGLIIAIILGMFLVYSIIKSGRY